MAFTSKPNGMSDAAWEIYQKKSAVPADKDGNKLSVERSEAHVVGDDPFQARAPMPKKSILNGKVPCLRRI